MIKGPKKIGNRQVIAKRKFSTATVIVIAALMVMIAMPTWKILTPATVPVEPRSPSTAVSSPLPVNLGSAGNYAILTQTGISSTGTTSIVGNIGVSPIAATAITGFGLTLDISGTFATSPLVTGNVYAASYVAPTPSVLTTAVSDMQTAYTNAAGRTADYSEFNAGNLGGQTHTTGVYKWSTGVTIPTSVTISGSSTDVWIFQIAGTLTVASATQVILSGGAQAKNIFWVVAGQTTLGTTSVFNGNILDQTAIVFNSGATLHGRALAQTAVTLIANTITEPALPPLVVSTIPANLATGVLINSKITATFSEAMDPTTINGTTFNITQGVTPVPGTVNYTGVTAVFTPTSSLASSTTYTANITTGAKDTTGNPLASNYVWNFTTGAAPDITPPMVSSTVPVNNSVGILTNSKIAAIFSKPMDPLTINGTTFNITQGVIPVAGTVVYSVVTAVFTPTSALAPGTTYTANITTGVTDLAGNHMVSNYTWNFTTSSATLVPVNLGSAANFAILAESGISTTGITSITGDIGVSPIAATAITGFGLVLDASGRFATSSLVTGNVYAADYSVPTPTVLTTAISNMTTAYANATGRTASYSNLYSGNIGGNIFSPGVYNWTTAVTMSSDITLTGSANDVWIFQVTGTLTTSNAARVILHGGAQSTNVFWVVTDTTVLGASTLFNGNILDKTVIVFLSGAMLSGRAFAQTAVTLIGNTIAIPIDLNAPTVSSTVPVQTAVGVAVNLAVSATFSKAMDPLTITPITFTLKQGASFVPGTVTYSLVTAVFTPASNLSASTTYTAVITTGAKDLAGDPLAFGYVWSFTTGAAPDTTAPTVSSTIPANTATGVTINSAMAALFSKAMNPLTVTTATFTLTQGITPVLGTVTYALGTAVFTPAVNLTASTTYTATITTGVTDLAGNPLASNYVWTFTTGAAPDITAPTVISTIPVNGSTGVDVSSAMTSLFSKLIDPLTVNTATITLMWGVTIVPGLVTYAGVTATFTPVAALSHDTVYTLTINIGVKDLAGNALAVPVVWSFTTGKAAQQPIDLGLAGNFAILAKSGITSAGPNTIIGDIGVSPIASTAITGFGLTMDASGQFATSSYVTGKVYAADYAFPTPAVLTTAVSDMQTAYTDGAGRTSPDFTELGAGNIGGMTLLPGLYKWSSGVTIPTSVTLTGSANDVWIFQIAGTLTLASAMQVILSGGAQAQNVFWVVGGQTYLGTTSVFNGNILDATAIDVNVGATLNGRALAQTAVTLDAYITIPVGKWWVFTQTLPPDTTAPVVTSSFLANAAPSGTISNVVVATFSKALNPSTINSTTCILTQGTTVIAGWVTYANMSVIFTPAANLTANTTYTLTITTGVKDTAGNALANAYVYTFTTAAAPAQAPTATELPAWATTLIVFGIVGIIAIAVGIIAIALFARKSAKPRE